jgi:hypothetical protein
LLAPKTGFCLIFCNDVRTKPGPRQVETNRGGQVCISTKDGATKRRRQRLSQCGDHRPQTHFLREAVRGLNLLGIENADQRPRSNRKPTDGRTVKSD